jgi:hypothetical protein
MLEKVENNYLIFNLIFFSEKRRADYDKYGLRGAGGAGQQQQHQPRGGPRDRDRRRTTAFPSAGGTTFPGFRSPFDLFREFFGDPFATGGLTDLDGLDPFFFAFHHHFAHHPHHHHHDPVATAYADMAARSINFIDLINNNLF